MKRTIFYSWQSDLDQKGNRNLIEDALKRAIKRIKNDVEISVEPVLDRDTSGIPGSPSIAASIFSKIAIANIFVADVSLINAHTGAKRLTPNPNVLVELGYAISQLGWDRIILVQNLAYETPEDLPFDLRAHRVVTYSYRSDHDDRSQARETLQGKLEVSLREALSESTEPSLPTGHDAKLWWGEWKVNSNGHDYGGHLFIREVSSTGFLFDLEVFSGAHTGQVTAYARLVSPDIAYSQIPGITEIGEICFRREMNANGRAIQVEETANCTSHHGTGVTFTGNFLGVNTWLFDSSTLNELELQRLHHATGAFFEKLRSCFQSIGTEVNIDTFEARVVVGAPRGLFTIQEAIVMVGYHGELWAAFIDDDVVRYFTTNLSWKKELPKTIEKWRERFPDKPIVFQQAIDVLPEESLDASQLRTSVRAELVSDLIRYLSN